MSDLNTEISITANADGVEAGVGRAKRSLADLGATAKRSGQDAADGVGKIGLGGDAAARKVDAATRAMQNSIQRLVAEQKAGEKGSRAYWEALADTRGVSAASLKPYLDQLDQVKAKTSAAKAASEDWMGSLRSINGLLAGLGAAVSIGGMSAFVKQSIDAADSMSKLSQKSGVAVESLVELNYAASLSDVSTEGLATGLRKLSQNMAEAAKGSKEQAAAFAAVGVNVQNLDGSLKGADEVLKELATRFSNFKDGPEKAALAIELFGKQGAELIPLLNGGAAGLSEMADEARSLGVVFGADLAKNAETFNDNLTRIQASSQGAATAIAGQLLPTLNLLTREFIAAKDGSQSFAMSLGGGLRTTVESATILYANVSFVLQGIGREIGAIGAQFAAIGRGDFSGWTAISDAVKADGKRARAELDKFTFDLLNAGILTSKAGAGRGTAPDPRSLGDTSESAPIVQVAEKAAKAAKEAQSEYDKLMQKLGVELPKAAAAAEAAQMGYNKAQTEFIALANGPAWAKFTDQERASVALKYEGIIASEQATDAQKLMDKANLDAAASREKYVASLATGIAKIRADIVAQQEATARMGLTKDAVAELDAAKLEMLATDLELQAIKALDRNLDQQTYDSLKTQAQLYRDLAVAKKDGAAKEIALDLEKANEDAAKEAQREWQRTADEINRSLTDALLRGFESGKDFAKNLRDTVVNMFKTLVLRPIISAVINPVAGAITGALGLAGTASAATAAASGGSILGSAGGILSGVGALAGNFGAGLTTGFSGLMAGNLGSTLGLGTGLIGSGATAGGIGTIVGALGPIALGIGALVAISKATKGETRTGGQFGVSFDGTVTNQRRGETYTYQGQQFDRDFSNGQRNALIAGQAYRLEGDPVQNEQAIRDAVSGTASGINAFLKALGSKATLTGFSAGLETSSKGRGGVFAGGILSDGTTFGESGKGDNYAGTLYEKFSTNSPDFKTALENFTLDLKQSTIQALQSVTDIPETVKKMLKGMDAEALSEEAANALLESINAQIVGVQNLTSAFEAMGLDKLAEMGFDAAAGLAAAAGGFDKLQTNLNTYYDNFYTDEEKRANLQKQVDKQFAELGIDVPKNRDEFRRLVEGTLEQVDVQDKARASLSKQINDAIAGAGKDGFTLADSGARSIVSGINPALLGNAEADPALAGKLNGFLTGISDLAAKGLDPAAFDKGLAGLIDVNAEVLGIGKDASKTAATLLALSGTFAQLNESADDAAARIAKEQADARDKALRGLERAVAREKEALQTQIDVAQDVASTMSGLFDLLKSNVRELYGEVDSTRSMLAAQGNDFITQALATARTTGYLPDETQLADAISAARSGLDSTGYSSQFELDRDRLVLAGKLSELEGLTGKQLTSAERTVKELEAQSEQLDKTLDYWKQQIDIANGTYEATLSVAQAVKDLTALTFPEVGYLKSEKDKAGGGSSGTGAPVAVFGGTDPSKTPATTGPSGSAPAPAGAASGAGDSGLQFSILLPGAGGEQSYWIPWNEDAVVGGKDWERRMRKLPGYAVGTNYVPRDMVAQIHEGEAIVPKAYNPAANPGMAGGSDDVVAELRALRAEMAELRAAAAATASNTAQMPQMADQFDTVAANGVLRTKVTA